MLEYKKDVDRIKLKFALFAWNEKSNIRIK